MNKPKEIEGIRFLGLEKLDEERLAIKSLINKSIIGLFFGLFLLLGAIGSENLLSTALILGVLIYCFRRLFFRYKRFMWGSDNICIKEKKKFGGKNLV